MANWVEVDRRSVYVGPPSAVILTREEAARFAIDDELQRECHAAARQAGCYGLVACHTIGGAVVGTVEVKHGDVGPDSSWGAPGPEVTCG